MSHPYGVVMSAVALLSLSVQAQNLGPVPTQTITQHRNDWPMYNHDVVGTRFNPEENTLNRDSVRQGLSIKWYFPTAGDVYATPSVVSDIVYAGDAEVLPDGTTKGTFYALRAKDGGLVWQQPTEPSLTFGPITASALVTNGTNGKGGMVIFGDQRGFIYGLDRETGDLLWDPVQADHRDKNPTAVIYGSPILVDGQVIIGVSSNEHPGKETFRGSVVSLNPNDGSINWQHYLITDEEQQKGSAGAGVWSTPTYDAGLKLVFVTTGNNYTVHATETSDAFVALEAATGHEKWHFQAHPNDKGQIEADIGDSPQVYTLGTQKVVGAGQKKTGIYWVLDASTGALVNKIRAVPNCKDSLGLFADSAIRGDVVFVNGVNCKLPANPAPAGEVVALNKDASRELWEFPTTVRIDSVLSGVAVANDVVYFRTSGLSSVLYALDATNGQPLTMMEKPVDGGISGPSVSNGQIYFGTGTKFASGVGSGNTGIVAIGLMSEPGAEQQR
jgi:outer membrane protein assembly factor BamB